MVLGLGDLEKGKKFANKNTKDKSKTRKLRSGQIVTLNNAKFRFANDNLYRIKANGDLAKEPISKSTLTYKNIMNPNNPRVKTEKGGVNKPAGQSTLAILLGVTGKSKTNTKGSGLKIAENKTNNKKNKEKVKVKKPIGTDSWKNFKTIAAAQKAGSRFFMGSDGKKKIAVTKEQLKKTGLSLREYANRKTKVKASKGAFLKRPTNPGLKKLPTQVRNRMGFMKKGGSVKK